MWRLKGSMREHVKTMIHEKCRDKYLGIEKISSNYEELASRTTENLCYAAQFASTFNLTQRFNSELCAFLNKTNENLGPNNKAKVHLLGNTHHGKMDIKESQKACMLAVKEKMKEDDMKIFPPTG